MLNTNAIIIEASSRAEAAFFSRDFVLSHPIQILPYLLVLILFPQGLYIQCLLFNRYLNSDSPEVEKHAYPLDCSSSLSLFVSTTTPLPRLPNESCIYNASIFLPVNPSFILSHLTFRDTSELKMFS